MRFWDEIRKYPVRFLKTSELWACYLSLGMSLAIVGPTLLDLRHQVKVEIKEISFLLPARAGGQAAGSLISKSNSSSYLMFNDSPSLFYSSGISVSTHQLPGGRRMLYDRFIFVDLRNALPQSVVADGRHIRVERHSNGSF